MRKKVEILIVLMLLTLAVFGQERLEPIEFYADSIKTDTTIFIEVTIEAYRAIRKTPITFKNLSKQEIDILNVGQEPAVILGTTPSVNTHSDAGNYIGYSYFRMRGIDQTRVNMTMDGIPLNESEDQGVYFSNYPDFFNSVNSVQIQRGVGTSSNGVASYAGSLNFQSPDLTNTQRSEVGLNYGSFNSYRIYTEYNSGIKNNKATYFRVSGLGTDGYKNDSKNSSGSAFLSTGLYKTKHKLKFTGFVGTQKNQMAWIGVPLEDIQNDPKTNANDPREMDNFFQGLMSLQYTYLISSKINFNVTAFYNNLNGNYDFNLDNFLGIGLGTEMYNIALRHNFGGVLTNINVYLNHFKISAGLQANRFNRRHIGSEWTAGQLYENDGYKNDFNAFTKVTYTLNKLSLFGDIQYRYTDFDYTGDVAFEKMTWNFLNYTAGINYFLAKDLSIYYSYGTTGREPTRNDIFNGEDNLPTDSLGNPMFNPVEAEYVYDNELGFRLQKEKWHLGINVYLMNFKNELVLNGQFGPNSLPLHSNVAESFRRGLEIDFGIKFWKLYYILNSSFAHNEISEDDIKFEPVLSPNMIINQSLGYYNDHLYTGVRLKNQGESFIDFANENVLPSFYSLDLFGNYTVNNFTFGLNINNITDQLILSGGYMGIYGQPLYYVQAGINYNVSIRWKF